MAELCGVNFQQYIYLTSHNWHRNLESFWRMYRGFHSYFAISVCLFGVVSNVLFIIILSKRSMLTPVTNVLTAIAACDMLLMTSNFIWLLNFEKFLTYFGQTDCDNRSEHWARFSLFYANFSVYCHTASFWLTVLLAGLRWCCVREKSSMTVEASWMRRARVAIGLTLLGVAALISTNSLSYTYRQQTVFANCTWYNVVPSKLSLKNGCFLRKLNWWMGGICYKLIPCCLLALFMGLLIHVMYRAKIRRRRLLQAPHNDLQDKTTLLLIFIVLFVWLSQLPQAILTILTGYYGWWFYTGVYKYLGDLFDDLSLVSSCINFFIYCLMSSQFRRVLKQTFTCRHARATNQEQFISLPIVVNGGRFRRNNMVENTDHVFDTLL